MTIMSEDEGECCKTLGLVAGEWTAEGLRKAFKARARKWHPDKNPERVELAERKMQQINHAYSWLKERGPVARAAQPPPPPPPRQPRPPSPPAPAKHPVEGCVPVRACAKPKQKARPHIEHAPSRIPALMEYQEYQLMMRLNVERQRVVNAKFTSVFDVEFLLTLWVIAGIDGINMHGLDVTAFWWQSVAEIWFGYTGAPDMSRTKHLKSLMTREVFIDFIGTMAAASPWMSLEEAKCYLTRRRQTILGLGAVHSKDWETLRKESIVIQAGLNVIG